MYLSPQVLNCFVILTMNTSTSFNWSKLAFKISFKNIKFCLVYFFWHFCCLYAGCFGGTSYTHRYTETGASDRSVIWLCMAHREWMTLGKRRRTDAVNTLCFSPKWPAEGTLAHPQNWPLVFYVSSPPCTVRLLCKCLTRSQQLICLYLVTYTE